MAQEIIKNRKEQNQMKIDEEIIRKCKNTNNSDLDTHAHLLAKIINESVEEVAMKTNKYSKQISGKTKKDV